MNGAMTGFIGAISDAWQEVRVHRGRVLLALVGVAAAVCALSVSMAVADITERTVTEQIEQYNGRPVTLSVRAMSEQSQLSVDQIERLESAWFDMMERSDITYATRESMDYGPVRFPHGSVDSQFKIVDQSYGLLRHVRLLEGSWFAPGDSERLAPAIVVSKKFWEEMGEPDLRTHPTVVSPHLDNARLVVIGVYEGQNWEGMSPEAYILNASYRAVAPEPFLPDAQGNSSMEMWIPADLDQALMQRFEQSLKAAADRGTSLQFQSNRQGDYGPGQDPSEMFRLLSLGIGSIILVLGALGLVNIAIVSVRQRIREIGVRRSFGASSGRVFFSVMMESVVATVVAGIVGVMIAVLIMRIPAVYEVFNGGITGRGAPAFPVNAAVIGLVAATIVGALAGLIPALIATRVKVIDAIRF